MKNCTFIFSMWLFFSAGHIFSTQLGAGGCQSFVIDAQGNLYLAGKRDVQFYTPEATNFIEYLHTIVAAGVSDKHSLFVDQNKNIWGIGENSDGRLGTNDGIYKEQLTLVATPSIPIKKIALGPTFTLMLDEAGHVWSCGKNNFGQLGVGDYRNRLGLTHVEALTNIEEIAAGFLHALALDNEGSVYVWGSRMQGELGLGNEEVPLTEGELRSGRFRPLRAYNLPKVCVIAAGMGHSLVVDETGAVWAWGQNDLGQLGIRVQRESRPKFSNQPIRVELKAWVWRIAAGKNFSLANDDKGNVWGWGDNFSGQLGLNTLGIIYTPTRADLGVPIANMAAGNDHTLFLDENGTVWGCGKTNYLQLGIENKVFIWKPTIIPDLPSISSARGRHIKSGNSLIENY